MAGERFSGRIPDGLLYDPEYDMWVRVEGDSVLVGATAYGIHLAGEVIGFTAKPVGAEVAHGRSLGTIECAKTVLAIHSPLACVLLDANATVEERPSLLNRDPYTAWMVRGRALDWENDRRRLVDAETYREQVRRCAPDAEIVT